jgi:hypothetical protein
MNAMAPSSGDVQRDLGGFEARLDEHDRRFDQIEQKIDHGFAELSRQIQDLFAAENRRRGMFGFAKVLIAGGALTGAAEWLRSMFHHHS